MKAAIYARVSTSNHGQNPEVQLDELRYYCFLKGWEVISEIQDIGFSGATDSRPGLKKLHALVRTQQVEVVLVTKLDRLFRSLKHLVNALDEFQNLGVEFVSIKDNIDFTTSTGRLLFGVLACLSAFEKDLIVERTLAGLAHARRKGVVLGRKRFYDYDKISHFYSQGFSYRQIQKLLGVSPGTIRTALKLAAQKTPSNRGAEVVDIVEVEND